MILYESEV